jgi:K+-transporting ATPase ATPase B chain
VVEGRGLGRRSAITGESAPVSARAARPLGVTGGTRVLSDRITVSITAAQGSTFLDRMISLVEGASARRRPTRSR